MTDVTFAKETVSANLEEEMRRSYLDYAMSVIVGRALPDVRDGLKPVHRRVLYAMSELRNDHDKPYKKSARVVGDVIGKYHPHGDTAVYDAIVRMAQSFSMRYPLVDGQGNFGSVDGDSPAAMRYTEIRLSRIAHELLSDLSKETVEFGLNYDETESQPLVLPTRVPNLLVNGSTGIAVGMATNVPPHNLTEIVHATLALIGNPDLSIAELMVHLPGPDFPTAGLINGRDGIRQAYATGRGRIQVRARAEIIQAASGRESIIIHELPYQVNKARLMEKIADLVKNKRLEGISAIRDESDRAGMRMVIELKRSEQADVVLNNLYQQTNLQSVFGINMVALVNNQPKLFNLKQTLEEFIKHRREVVTRRTIFELRKARERTHLLEGLAVALANIDEIIAIIKAAHTPAEAKEKLLAVVWKTGVVSSMLARSEHQDVNLARPAGLDKKYGVGDDGYWLSPDQVQAILELRLHRLTGLEQNKIHSEYSDLLDEITKLLHILQDADRLMELISEELVQIQQQFGTPRRTEILDTEIDLSMEDLIIEQEVVVTLSHAGYVKSQPVADYTAQHRGGKGRIATRTKQEDFVKRMFIANSHSTILCFSDLGRVYWLRVFQLPQAGPQARGKPLVNLLPLARDEQITAVLPIKDFDADKSIIMATANGTINKCNLANFSRPRPSGLIAIKFRTDDYLVGVTLSEDDEDVLLFSKSGQAVRFSVNKVRTTGRGSIGVHGIRLKKDDKVIALIVTQNTENETTTKQHSSILVGTQNGYGKRTPISEFSCKGRGGKGVIAIKTSARNGELVSALLVGEEDQVMLLTDGGTLIRTCVDEISIVGRNTQGVRLIRLKQDERLIGANKVEDSSAVDEPAADEPAVDEPAVDEPAEPTTLH